VICLGLYRLIDSTDDGTIHHPFVFTNPPEHTILRETDAIILLGPPGVEVGPIKSASPASAETVYPVLTPGYHNMPAVKLKMALSPIVVENFEDIRAKEASFQHSQTWRPRVPHPSAEMMEKHGMGIDPRSGTPDQYDRQHQPNPVKNPISDERSQGYRNRRGSFDHDHRYVNRHSFDHDQSGGNGHDYHSGNGHDYDLGDGPLGGGIAADTEYPCMELETFTAPEAPINLGVASHFDISDTTVDVNPAASPRSPGRLRGTPEINTGMPRTPVIDV